MKKYPKMSPHMLQSAHWFQNYGPDQIVLTSSMSADFVQWPHHWIGHEKLPQNDPSYATICSLVPKLWKGLLPCQLICTVTSPMNRTWKTTPKWPLICYILPMGSKGMERSSSMSADLYSDLTIVYTGLKVFRWVGGPQSDYSVCPRPVWQFIQV